MTTAELKTNEHATGVPAYVMYNAIRDTRQLTCTEKLVLVMLWSRGEPCWPSLTQLAADCGLSEAVVEHALKTCASKQWLTVDEQHANPAGAGHAGRNHGKIRLSDLYWVHEPPAETFEPPF